MTRVCPQCHQPQSATNSRICEYCQAELTDNGLLADSLAVWQNGRSVTLWQRIVPLAITAVSGLLTAYAGNSVYLFAGLIAAAACYYVLGSHNRNRGRNKNAD